MKTFCSFLLCILLLFSSCKKNDDNELIGFIKFKFNDELIQLQRYSDGDKFDAMSQINKQPGSGKIITSIQGGKQSEIQCHISLPLQETGDWIFNADTFSQDSSLLDYQLEIYKNSIRYLFVPNILYTKHGGELNLIISEFNKTIGSKIKGTFSGIIIELDNDYSVPDSAKTVKISEGEFDVQIEIIN